MAAAHLVLAVVLVADLGLLRGRRQVLRDGLAVLAGLEALRHLRHRHELVRLVRLAPVLLHSTGARDITQTGRSEEAWRGAAAHLAAGCQRGSLMRQKCNELEHSFITMAESWVGSLQ